MYGTLTNFQPCNATDRFCEKPSVSYIFLDFNSYRFVGGTGTNRNTHTHACTHTEVSCKR